MGDGETSTVKETAEKKYERNEREERGAPTG